METTEAYTLKNFVRDFLKHAYYAALFVLFGFFGLVCVVAFFRNADRIAPFFFGFLFKILGFAASLLDFLGI